jgi:hypothetical protein
MGLFDAIYSEEGIKCNCGEEIHDFQTKDLDNLLEQFIVHKDGTIHAEDYKLTILPEAERNQFGFPFFKKEIQGFYKMDLTTNLHCHTICGHGKCWIDMTLSFVDGTLVNKIIQVSERE